MLIHGSGGAQADCDTTLQASGGWFWTPGPGAVTRTLADLQIIYEESVGRNCNLELGFD